MMDSLSPASRQRAALLCLPALLLALVLLPSLGIERPLDAHEVLVAQTAREMRSGGDWIVPHFADQVRLNKPPLAYWSVATLSSYLGCENEWVARLPSALAALATVLLITVVTSRIWGTRVGLWAGMIQVLMPWQIWAGASALVESQLVLWTAVALFSLLGRRGRWVVLFWSAMGMTILAKGPVVAPLLLVTAAIFWTRRPRARRADATHWLLSHAGVVGLGIFLLLALAWPIAVWMECPDALTVWRAQSVDRFFYHWGPKSRPWFYYFYIVPLWTLPWTPLWIGHWWRAKQNQPQSPAAISQPVLAAKRDLATETDRLLLLWFCVGMAFFTLSEGKRDHYILPVLLPLAIWSARGLERLCEGIAHRHATMHERGTTWCSAFRAGAMGLSALGGTFIVWMVLGFHPTTLLPAIAVGVGIGAMVWSLRMLWDDRLTHEPNNTGDTTALASAVPFALGAVVLATIRLAVLPMLLMPTGTLAMLNQHESALLHADRVVQFGSNDRWLIYPVGRSIEWIGSADKWKEEPQASSLILVPLRRAHELEASRPVVRVDCTANYLHPTMTRWHVESDPGNQWVLYREEPAPRIRATIAGGDR